MFQHIERLGKAIGRRRDGNCAVKRNGENYSDLAEDFESGEPYAWGHDGSKCEARTLSNMTGSSLPGGEGSDGDSSDEQASPHTCAGVIDTGSPQFNMFVGVAIIMNAILIGLETEYGEESFKVCEYVFCAFFVMELGLRMHSESPQSYIRDPWNLFDFTLVSLSVVDILMTIRRASAGGTRTHTSFSVFRTFRMLRILRTLRLFHMFRELQVILHAFSAAFEGVLWIGLLVFLLDYVCAVFLTQAIGHNSHLWDEDQEQIETWFGHIGSSMRTLFIVMTLSEWVTIAFTLSKVYTERVVFPLMIAYILCASFTMLSLITGVICEALLDATREDETHKMNQIEEGQDHLVKTLVVLLDSFDKDSDGAITREELELAFQSDVHLLPKLWSLEIQVDREDVLAIHDRFIENTPGKTSVKTDIFLEELTNQRGAAKASHCTNLRAQMLHAHADIRKDVNQLNDKLDRVLQYINAPK